MRWVAFGLVLWCALVVVGCGGGKETPTVGSKKAPVAPVAAAGMQGTVQVTLNEWAVALASGTVKAGKVTFQVKNAGNLEHDFVIEGVGKIPLILAGETKTLTVDLKPGTYTVLCSLPGHKEAGMQTKLTVSR